ncbi:MAG: hypothetical protein C0497_10150 [Gemmatimonas sp.]|nr:hypothetical protein [Gemmatimonas sp.]
MTGLVVLGIAIANISPDPIGVFVDDGIYLLVAKAIAAGEGYRYTFLPEAPAAIHYPPVFPLVLAAMLKISPAFPDNVAALKFVNPVCLAIGAVGAVRLGTNVLRLDAAATAVVVAICAVIAPVLMLTNALMSEPLFFALLVWSLVAVEDAVARGGVRRAVVAGVLCALLALVRTIGGVLVPAALLALWWRSRRSEAAWLAVTSGLFLAPWQLWVWSESRDFPAELQGSYGPYLAWLVDAYRREPALLGQVVERNVTALWHTLGFFFAPRLPGVLKHAAAAVFVAAFACGLVAVWRRAASMTGFVLLYLVVVLVWPYSPARFLGAVWPVVGLVLLASTQTLHAVSSRFRVRGIGVPALLVGVLFVGHGTYALRGLGKGWAGSAQRTMTNLLWPEVAWSARHVGARDLVASDANVMISLYTGLPAVPVSMLTPAQYVTEKSVPVMAEELGALYRRYRPTLLLLVREAPELDAIAEFARQPNAPEVVRIGLIPGGGTAFALRERR